MKKSHLIALGVALFALAISGPVAAQQKKTLAVVVKGLDNPFFTVLGDGCALWNKENPNSEYTCLYTGPASSADEAGEVQDRRGPDQQGRGRHRHLAVERAGDGQHAQGQGSRRCRS